MFILTNFFSPLGWNKFLKKLFIWECYIFLKDLSWNPHWHDYFEPIHSLTIPHPSTSFKVREWIHTLVSSPHWLSFPLMWVETESSTLQHREDSEPGCRKPHHFCLLGGSTMGLLMARKFLHLPCLPCIVGIPCFADFTQWPLKSLLLKPLNVYSGALWTTITVTWDTGLGNRYLISQYWVFRNNWIPNNWHIWDQTLVRSL